MIIAIIPARSGSKRIPHKNVRLFHGKPIMAYSIECARSSKLFDEIVVSTDSQDYAQVAKAYGAKVHMRAHALADDQTGTQAVTRAALLWWQATHEGALPDFACCIYATCPLMHPTDLIDGFTRLKISDDAAYSAAVSAGTQPPPYAGQWFWGHANAFVQGVPLEPNCLHIPVRSDRDCDINTEEDWQRAERMFTMLPENCQHDPVLITEVPHPDMIHGRCRKCGLYMGD